MNADLTLNAIVFKKSYDSKEESLRQSTARGINTPDKLIIKSQDYVDSATKVAGKRYTGRIDLEQIDANLQKIVGSFYFVAQIPSTMVTGDINTLVATFKATVADAAFITAVLNNEK